MSETKFLLAKSGSSIHLVEIKKIIKIYFKKQRIIAEDVDGRLHRLALGETIRDLAERGDRYFLKISHGMLVNIDFIRAIDTRRGHQRILLKSGEAVPVSRSRFPRIKQQMWSLAL